MAIARIMEASSSSEYFELKLASRVTLAINVVEFARNYGDFESEVGGRVIS